MKRILFLILSFMFLYCTVNAQTPNGLSTETIKNEFVELVTANWSDFKVCEYYSSTEDKKKFIEQSIDHSLTSGSENIAYKEIYVTNQDSGETLHLGIAIVHYSISDQKNPIDTQIKKHGFLKNTKILTKYMLKKIDAKLFIYYSETFIDEKVKKYFIQKEEQINK
ncbi:MAG: hypothetical protein GY737_25105 [Desulfobacteraceae bacterium]|nr:hypothetical protein [Desulfobacteraceae bacterium]